MAKKKDKNPKKGEGTNNPFLTPKKKKSKGIWIFLALFLIVGLGAAALVFNLFGAKDIVMAFFIENEPGYISVSEQLAAREADIAEQELEFQTRQTELNERQSGLDSKEARLDKREQELSIEVDPAENTAVILTAQQEELYTDIATIFQSMETEIAARTMVAMNDYDQVAVILTYMKPKSSGAILEAFDDYMAAQISRIIAEQ